jgi:hypothetical protein
MKEYENNNLNNFIAGWYIDSTVCDNIVKKGEEDISVFLSGIKQYTDADLKVFDENLFDQYCNNLWPVIEAYKKMYPLCFEDLQRWGLSAPRIQRYEPGMYYNMWHCENQGYPSVRNRHLAYMTYLNDIDIGGGTEFINQKLTTPAQKGLTLLWPAIWTHYHRGVVAPKDTKYIITGWCLFP